jgi:HlyD family secretion protein
MRVLFERWGGDAPLEGRVERIEPTGFTKISALGVEEQRVLAICEFTSPAEAWERLGDGYRVEARFILWEGQDILCVPTSALFRAGEGWAVFTLEPEAEEARLRAIVAGRRGGLLTEVVEGLEAGELVITHPPRELEDGGRASAKGGE